VIYCICCKKITVLRYERGKVNVDRKLFFNAISKFLLGVVLIGALVFLPAGTLNYTGGIIFMCVLFVPMFAAGLVMMVKSPELLTKRLNVKEREKEQGVVIKLSGLMFLVGFILAGLDFRFGWIRLPIAVNIIATVIFLVAYILYAEVLRENAYLSRTIEVQEGQRVVDTGLYGIVRHPMYAVTLALFLSMPLILGSLVSFLVFLAYPFIIAARIRNEEKVLTEGLEGYKEYKEKVKYRLIPFIW
jgi:protein-S-isoprenylcysteine O-methyltransferase Ste14